MDVKRHITTEVNKFIFNFHNQVPQDHSVLISNLETILNSLNDKINRLEGNNVTTTYIINKCLIN